LYPPQEACHHHVYRDFAKAAATSARHGFDSPAAAIHYFQERLPLRVINS